MASIPELVLASIGSGPSGEPLRASSGPAQSTAKAEKKRARVVALAPSLFNQPVAAADFGSRSGAPIVDGPTSSNGTSVAAEACARLGRSACVEPFEKRIPSMNQEPQPNEMKPKSGPNPSKRSPSTKNAKRRGKTRRR